MPLTDRERRRRRIERLWARGQTLKQIGAKLDLTPPRVSAEIARMRAAGRDVPYRRRRRDPRETAMLRRKIELRWNKRGYTEAEIAQELSVTLGVVQHQLSYLRGQGRLERRAIAARRGGMIDLILKMWSDGMTTAEIAAALGTGESDISSRISRMRRNHHLQREPQRRRANGEAKERRARISELWLAGRTLDEIASDLRMTTGSVATIISQMRKAGADLPYRPGGRRRAL